MELQEQIDSLAARVAALEARQPSPHNTPETNPFMGRAPQLEPKEPLSDDFQQVFGYWLDQNGRRRFAAQSEDEAVWLSKQPRFEGFIDALPEEAHRGIGLLAEHFAVEGIDVTARVIGYNGQQYIVFPNAGVGYGTPKALMVGVKTFTQDSIDGRMDRTIELIEQRRARG